jgi:copper/silver efflux system protein
MVVMASREGTPILVKDLAEVRIGRRCGAGGRTGTARARRSAASSSCASAKTPWPPSIGSRPSWSLKAGLPEGVTIHTAYDRSGLIDRAVANLKEKLLEESIVVALVIVLFLFHLPSAMVAIITLPVAYLMAFIIMYAQGINANIMSLGGIAIAIGAMIDAAIIMIENAHKHLERDRGKKPHGQIILDAAKEVGPTLFFSLLVITVSFVPVFTLTEQAGTPVQAAGLYQDLCHGGRRLSLHHPGAGADGLVHPRQNQGGEGQPAQPFADPSTIPWSMWSCAGARPPSFLPWRPILSIAYPLSKMGSEFMPALYEGDLLYMPTTLPGLSVTKAKETPAADRPRSSASFPRWSRSSARSAGPRPPPIRRR